MTKKKNRLFTFCCSLLPGAGEMYLGFFKHGVSTMALFFLLLTLSSSLFPPLIYMAPVVWFYSFFHSNHLASLADDEFYMLEDDYLFHIHNLAQTKDLLLTRYRKPFSFCLIFLGAAVLWQNASEFIRVFFSDLLSIPEPLQEMLFWFNRRLPQMLVAVGIILLGIWLIKEKRSDLFFPNGAGGGIGGALDKEIL